jgi:hypothetical protein
MSRKLTVLVAAVLLGVAYLLRSGGSDPVEVEIEE